MGTLIGIARAHEKLAALEELPLAAISIDAGIEGDCRGLKLRRQVSILFREGWEDACRDAGAELPWTTRRANLYVEGMTRPYETGGRIAIGDVVLLVVEETAPCHLMDRAHMGLRTALIPEWRGGVCCKVVTGGTIRSGDHVSYSPA